MEQNKLVKYIDGELIRINNQLAITDKLLRACFDYLAWWAKLDEIWKDLFRTELAIQIGWLDITQITKARELTIQEEVVLNLKEVFEENDDKSRLESLKYLTKVRRIIIGRQYEFVLKNLNPLKVFTELENIEFINADIEDITALESLNKLRRLDFSRAKVSKVKIENFSREHPNCEIILESREQ